MKDSNILDKVRKSNLTDFQKKVLIYTYDIPKGEVRTYKQVAIGIKAPHAYRAVGSALKKNPFPIIVPCHRVIKSNGDTGNYSGVGGRKGKVLLLKKEHAI